MNQPNRNIIQVGAVTVDLVRRRIEPLFDELVKGVEPLDSYVSQLTGIEAEALGEARPATEVLDAFWDAVRAVGEPVRLGAWGLDCKKVYKDSLKAGVTVPDPVRMYDLKEVCSPLRIGKKGSVGCSLSKMLDAYGLPFEGHHHNAYADAHMTAKLVLALLEEAETLFQRPLV